MKLFYSPFHSFAHKVLIVTHDAGLWDQVARVPSFPFRNLDKEFVTGQYDLSEIAPLGKVPCLALDDGMVLFASQTVVEYLDANRVSGDPLYPEPGKARWDALRRLALGDALFEFAVQMSMEAWIPQAQRRLSLYQWLWPKIIQTLDDLQHDMQSNPERRFDIGDVGVLQGISYLESMGDSLDNDPVNPAFDWRAKRPQLSIWFNTNVQRPSVLSHYKQNYDDDLSPENHRRHVEEVVTARESRE